MTGWKPVPRNRPAPRQAGLEFLDAWERELRPAAHAPPTVSFDAQGTAITPPAAAGARGGRPAAGGGAGGPARPAGGPERRRRPRTAGRAGPGTRPVGSWQSLARSRPGVEGAVRRCRAASPAAGIAGLAAPAGRAYAGQCLPACALPAE